MSAGECGEESLWGVGGGVHVGVEGGVHVGGWGGVCSVQGATPSID